MLKKVSNCVLGLSASSTYPRGYASGAPAALLDALFEHPSDDFKAFFKARSDHPFFEPLLTEERFSNPD
jgi:hypothetical protein